MVSAFSLLVICATLGGAAAAVQEPATTPQAAAAAAYVVGPGDILEVTVIDQADVSRSTTVQPDGRFTMPLLGDIEVAGKTVAEIQRIITEALSKDFLVNPQVEVRVREYASQFALVLGEVMNPGRRALRGGTRLIDIAKGDDVFRRHAAEVGRAPAATGDHRDVQLFVESASSDHRRRGEGRGGRARHHAAELPARRGRGCLERLHGRLSPICSRGSSGAFPKDAPRTSASIIRPPDASPDAPLEVQTLAKRWWPGHNGARPATRRGRVFQALAPPEDF
jgi:polysaccharide export outer membrane protein